MLIRYWINIAILMALAVSSWSVLVGTAPYYGWQRYVYLSAPWLLLYGSLKAWYRCFTWRRMMLTQNISPDLSRGKRAPSKSKNRTSQLERACQSLFLLPVAALLKQFGMAEAGWWMAIFAGFIFAFRFVLSVVA